MSEEDNKAKTKELYSYVFLIGFGLVIAYIFVAAFEGLWPYTIIGYAPLYIQLVYPLGLYFLYWAAISLLILGLYFQERSMEVLIFIFLIAVSISIIIIVGGMIPPI
ncbi:MAG: hypothetical protein GF329_15220 [Candidatus Lokiarchaeota archaeon]|nr:hypothetical protein [Candidatus Lokiarchaeota archaeon]